MMKNFAECAYRSSELYWDYVKKESHARIVINVIKIEQIGEAKFCLHTAAKSQYLDSAVVEVLSNGIPLDYALEDIKILEYSETENYVIVLTTTRRCFDAISKAKPSDISLVSDLSFLIKNVQRWYKDNYNKLRYPPTPCIDIDESLLPAELSNNQRESVIQALGNPVSYVWGAPGTGKTQMVLSNAILQYIKIKESVLLVAPTNNALEQSLRGLIKILDKNNFSTKYIVRFGHATSEFVTQYPEICEAGHYENLISNYKKDIDNLREKAEFQATYDRTMILYNEFQKIAEKVLPLRDSLEDIEQKAKDNENEYNLALLDLQTVEQEKNILKTEIEQLRQHEKKQARFELIRSSYNTFSGIVMQYNTELDHISDQIRQAQKACLGAEQDENTARQEYISLLDKLNGILHERQKIKNKVVCFLSRRKRSKYDCEIANCQSETDLAKEKSENKLAVYLHWQETIADLKARTQNTRDARDKHPELFALSIRLFGKSLPYSELSDALSHELDSFTGFSPDYQIDTKIESKQSQYDIMNSRKAELESSCASLKVFADETTLRRNTILVDLANLEKSTQQLALNSLGNKLSFDELKEKIDQEISQWKHFERIDDIESKIAQKESELLTILTQVKRIAENKLVIACTMDYLISHYDMIKSLKTNHAFVDEAAYCPLIKAAPAFALGVPVTLLGDHFQLPPICEMDRDAIISQKENHLIFLWDLSAIYFPALFDETVTVESLFKNYSEGTLELPQRIMTTSFLIHTFRFGNKLASVLDKFVYRQGFEGEDDSNMEITIIDAPRLPSETQKRGSVAEATAIKGFIRKYQPKDYAILVPYKEQRTCVQKVVNPEIGKLYTIHGSQGREWDTVIISVADGSRKWFMSSKIQKSNGKTIVNTAVSRARKHIVLVLDYQYWQTCNDELISGIAKLKDNLIDGNSL